MLTLKNVILVKLVTEFINDSNTREIIDLTEDQIWKKFIRKRTSASDIPLILQENIIAFIKPIQTEVSYWMDDHEEMLPLDKKLSLKFCFNADGTVDRVKTADLLIDSKLLDAQTRFVLACQYWSGWDVLKLFYTLHKSARVQILDKYSTPNEYFEEYEENVEHWIDYYRHMRIIKSKSRGLCYDCFNWTNVSLQSRLLDDLSEEKRQSILDDAFENTVNMQLGGFCLSRMSVEHREQLLTFFPLKVLWIYLFWPYHHFFMDAVNKVWDRLPEKHFLCLLHIIICQKIVAFWKDFDYVNLLREFWYKSPDRLKHRVEGSDIFEILMEILKNSFHPKYVPENFYLHDACEIENACFCAEIIVYYI
ncbi:uncharacterized protein TNIN_352931 [Trichonephila inaurata madagascariensis]|uniref:Uncharacterized protein n=1 Tax=Trichonephila inaurata madagascariensis TaxID=2747483 RepID=A0A8X6YBS6_9ARAC|nr:uncharacterized protein TNIN_352931 [Trichonephila inaurata madagascariensis]